MIPRWPRGAGRTPAASARQADATPHEDAIAELLDDEAGQARGLRGSRGTGERHEEQEERHGQPVVEAGLDVERLANLQRHARAVDDDLPQPGVGRRRDGGQDAGFPDGKLAEDHQRGQTAQQEREQHAGAEEPARQGPDVAQDLEIGPARVGEEQQHQARFGEAQEEFSAPCQAGTSRSHRKTPMPAAVKSLGALSTVRSIRAETRL